MVNGWLVDVGEDFDGPKRVAGAEKGCWLVGFATVHTAMGVLQ